MKPWTCPLSQGIRELPEEEERQAAEQSLPSTGGRGSKRHPPLRGQAPPAAGDCLQVLRRGPSRDAGGEEVPEEAACP